MIRPHHLLLCAAFGLAMGMPARAETRLDLMNQPLPDLDNKPHKLSDWRGKIVVAASRWPILPSAMASTTRYCKQEKPDWR